jgi:prefoldin subunit 5
MMNTKQRLDELRLEFERGQQQLDALDQRRAEVRETMLRISGAIHILEELVASENAEPPAASKASVDSSIVPPG